MKKISMFLMALVCANAAFAGAGFWDENAFTVTLSVNGVSSNWTGKKTGETANALGTVSELTLSDYLVNVWKDESGNICSSSMFYRIYTSGSASGNFTEIVGTWKSDNGSNQVWGTQTSVNTSLIDTLSSGNYVLEIYFKSTGSTSSSSDCSSDLFLNNGDSNYTATFTIATTPIVILKASTTSAYIGQSVTLTATPINVTTPTTKLYVKVPGSDSFTETTSAYILTATGTYTFKAEVYEGSETSPAATSSEVTVTSNALPSNMYIKHPWGDGLSASWTWKEMTGADSIYTHNGLWGGVGANINTTNSDAGASWFPSENITGADVLTIGDSVQFTYNILNNALSVTKCTTTPTNINLSDKTTAIISTANHSIQATFAGTRQVSVYTMQGQLIDNQTATNTYTCTTNSGIYLVRIDQEYFKIRVK